MRTPIAFLGIALTIAAPASVVKRIAATANSPNLLQESAWKGFGDGFEREGETLACDNGVGVDGRRGASQTVDLNQTAPAPIVAEAWSRAEGVGGARDGDYSLYLDLVYADGTPLWGQVASFQVGTHDWERRSVVVRPSKPVKTVTFQLLLRKHAGKAWFRGPTLRQLTGSGAVVFDGVPVIITGKPREGFQVRDVGGDGSFVDVRGGLARRHEWISMTMSDPAGISFACPGLNTSGGWPGAYPVSQSFGTSSFGAFSLFLLDGGASKNSFFGMSLK